MSNNQRVSFSISKIQPESNFIYVGIMKFFPNSILRNSKPKWKPRFSRNFGESKLKETGRTGSFLRTPQT